MDIELLPWEGIVLFSFILALLILYTIIRWVFKPRPKGRFPIKRTFVFLVLIAVIFIPFQVVDRFPEKLRAGLQTTSAFTTENEPLFKELRARFYSQPPEELFDTALVAMNQLGWQVTDRSTQKETIRARLSRYGFWDDEFLVSFVPQPDGTTRVDIQSQAIDSDTPDLGANRRHIQEFHQALDTLLGIEPALEEELP